MRNLGFGQVGQEPDITGDLTNVGMRRSDGLKAELALHWKRH